MRSLPLLLAACHPAPPAPAVTDPAWHPAPPPPDDAIYFVMVDRFANGDPSNDGDVDPDDPSAFHGGDLRGVIEHLDDLQALGVRTVWLSPVFSMRTEKFYDWGAFHGYWVQDLRHLEPRFGDEATLRELSDALHARGMRLLLDMVWNHVAMDAPLQAEHPGWFHREGGIQDWNDPHQLVFGEVHGLPDFAQENPEVYDYLLGASRHWIEIARPDGFRIDAVRHMPKEFLGQISQDLRAEAGDGFLLLGEDFQGDPVALAETFRDGGFGAMFDFPMHYAMLDVFCDDRSPGRLGAMLSGDGAYPDAGRLVTFLDNHDLPRINTRCHGDLGRVRRALAFQLTTRGIPSITWGTEAALEGEGEPENRADMVFSEENALAADLQTLLAFRRRHPALTEGVTVQPSLTDGLLIHGRVAARESASVVLNGTGGPLPLRPPTPVLTWLHPVEALVADDALHLVDLAAGGELPATLAPGALLVIVEAADDGLGEDETVADRLEYHLPGSGRAALTLTATGVPLESGDQLVLTGSGRALGNWDPARPAGTFKAQDGALTLALEAPSESILEVKLVVVHADGSVTWQAGENRYLQVPEPAPENAMLVAVMEGAAWVSWHPTIAW
ncbi:MAG: alpha-amylase family glycosyl hydrolase [Pseudomonadota bacterium]